MLEARDTSLNFPSKFKLSICISNSASLLSTHMLPLNVASTILKLILSSPQAVNYFIIYPNCLHHLFYNIIHKGCSGRRPSRWWHQLSYTGQLLHIVIQLEAVSVAATTDLRSEISSEVTRMLLNYLPASRWFTAKLAWIKIWLDTEAYNIWTHCTPLSYVQYHIIHRQKSEPKN